MGSPRRTPLIEAREIAASSGYPLLLKLETLQPFGAFKIRGAAHALLRLGDQARARGVVCCSTGNHGRAVAYAGKPPEYPRHRLSVQSRTANPKSMPSPALGATVACARRQSGRCAARGRPSRREKSYTDISPFDHRDVILGQATIALELLAERPDLTQIVVPLSGGGLIGGIAFAAKSLKPSIRITGVSMEHGAAMHESLKAGHPHRRDRSFFACRLAWRRHQSGPIDGPSISAAGMLMKRCWSARRKSIAACGLCSSSERIVAEGAGAVGIAALLAGKIRPDGPTAMIVSGQNVDMDQFMTIVRGEPVRLGDRLVKG